MIAAALLTSLLAVSPCSADTMSVDSVLTMRQIIVEAKAKPISMRGDTIVYAFPAVTTHEGERLRALLRDVPGVEILSDGTIKARGRLVDRILLNGHELIGLGTSTVLDNMPASYLQSILLYDDAARNEKETGIYDGEVEQVMDIVTTEDKRAAWLVDASAGYGSRHRYSANVSASRYSDVWQNMFSATFDNLPAYFGIGESYYCKLQKASGTADTDHGNVAASSSWQKGAWEVQGSAFYDRASKVDDSESILDAFLKGHSSRSERVSNNHSLTNSVNAQFSVVWRDDNWIVHLDPVVSWSRGARDFLNSNSTFTDDILVNQSKSSTHVDDDMVAAGLHFSLNRRLGSSGRNIDIKGNVNYQSSTAYEQDESSISFAQPTTSTLSRLRSDGSDDIRSGMLSIAYIEPIGKRFKLKAEYTIGLSGSNARRPVESLESDTWTVSDALSRTAESSNIQHKGKVALQYSHGPVRALVGVLIDNNNVRTRSRRYQMEVDTARHTTDWSPEVSFHYTNKRGLTVTASYDGRSRQPSIFDLLQGEDISDPLNVRRGNPGLRPSFLQQLRLTLSHFEPATQRQINLSAGFDWETNAITDRVEYDAVRGIRWYQPININGNRSFISSWGLQSNLFGTSRLWLDFQGDFSLARIVGYQTADYGSLSPLESLFFSTIRSHLQQFLALQYRFWYMTVKPYGFLSYDHINSQLEGAGKKDVFAFGYGGVLRLEHPCGLSVSCDFYNQSRRGYLESGLNTNHLILDAELAYAFLRNQAAEIRLIACDILRQRDIVDGAISQVGRTERVARSSVNSYYMATFTYRF